MQKSKSAMQTAGILTLIYVVAWILGEHGHTYFRDPAKKIFISNSDSKIGSEWVCEDEEQGPFWDEGKEKDPVCHVPARKCPALWFPVATQAPCPYKDPLGGPYTKDDLVVLKQMKHQQ